MAKGIITNAAGATDTFFYITGNLRDESASETEVVLSARILAGAHRGERATVTAIGEFDLQAQTGLVTEFQESVGGKLHFSLEMNRPTPIDAFLTGEFFEALTLVGNRFANVLIGDVRNDRLYGNNGADKLLGLKGADLLVGGAGADRFIYASTRDSTPDRTDTIRDFGRGDDVINLKAIDADVNADGGQAFDFIGSDAFSGAAGELRIGGGGRLVLGDTDGDGAADLAIRLTGAPAIHADDFIL